MLKDRREREREIERERGREKEGGNRESKCVLLCVKELLRV